MSIESWEQEQAAKDVQYKTRHAQKNRQWRIKRKQLGLCYHCSSPAVPNRIYCVVCNEAIKKNIKETYWFKRERGYCGKCWDQAVKGCILCQKHREAHNQRQRLDGQRKKLQKEHHEIIFSNSRSGVDLVIG